MSEDEIGHTRQCTSQEVNPLSSSAFSKTLHNYARHGTLFSDEYLGEIGSLAGRSAEDQLARFLHVDPQSTIGTIKTIVEFFQAGEKDRADALFRNSVLRKLDEVISTLSRIQQQIAELGVLVINAIGEIPILIASNNLRGQIVAAQTVFSVLDDDQQTAKSLWERLHATTYSAAHYGDVLIGDVALGIVTLESIHRYTGWPTSILSNMYAIYTPFFEAYLNENRPQSIRSQLNRTKAMMELTSKNIVHYSSHKPTIIGTTDYGQTIITEHLSKTGDGWFSCFYSTQPAESRQQEPGTTRVRGRGDLFLTESGVFNAITDPLNTAEVLLYLLGQRNVESPSVVESAHGGDRHFDEWRNHFKEHAYHANVSVSLRRHCELRASTLVQSVELAIAILERSKAGSPGSG